MEKLVPESVNWKMVKKGTKIQIKLVQVRFDHLVLQMRLHLWRRQDPDQDGAGEI